jgi:hypothetical protein
MFPRMITTSTAMANRRHFLRGMSALIGLPFLESLAGQAVTRSERPVRMAFLYAPNGRNMSRWTPQGTGRDWALSPSLEPLTALKKDFSVISGLDCEMAKAHGDGPGDHSRAAAAFLTGVHPRKTSGTDLHAGISADQIAATTLGRETRLPSLELGKDAFRPAGRCDSGYACAYQYNLSWRSAAAPSPPEVNPRTVFERLFGAGDGGGAGAQQARLARRRSVLDFVKEQAKGVAGRLDAQDRGLFTDYLDNIREVERRIELQEKHEAEASRRLATPSMTLPSGVPQDFRTHLRLLFDLLHLAFQTDSTRVCSFMMATEASGRLFPELGALDPHHTISHHQGNAESLELLAKIDRWYVTELAVFLQKLKDTADGSEGSLLDASMILYGCGIADGNDHGHENLPILLAGRGGGTLSPGQHLILPGAMPVTNLLRSMLTKGGVAVDKIGDSTDLLVGI